MKMRLLILACLTLNACHFGNDQAQGDVLNNRLYNSEIRRAIRLVSNDYVRLVEAEEMFPDVGHDSEESFRADLEYWRSKESVLSEFRLAVQALQARAESSLSNEEARKLVKGLFQELHKRYGCAYNSLWYTVDIGAGMKGLEQLRNYAKASNVKLTKYAQWILNLAPV